MTLRTRKPSGQVAYPLVLVEGGAFAQSPVVNPVAGIPVVEAKSILWADVCDRLDRDRAKEVATKVWAAAGLDGRAEVTQDELDQAKALLVDELEGMDPFEGLPNAKPADSSPEGDQT